VSSGAPVISVVVLSYNARGRIDIPLQALRGQDIRESYEVIVVDSGADDCACHVAAAYPEARIVRSRARLGPGAARNRGWRAAHGRYIAFLADDCAPVPEWLRLRVAKHREGFPAVGGSVINGTPRHPVGCAGYFLEYSALIPSAKILPEQGVPHSVSYDRQLFDRLGDFPEDTLTGEDTLFNRACVRAGVPIGFQPGAALAHRNLTGLRAYLAHQYDHGRGLLQCVERHGLFSATGTIRQPISLALWRIFVVYPARRWWAALKRIARGRPAWASTYVAVSPLVWAGLWATAAGSWAEWRALRRGA
jgi:glycosyltransferase involved in cell wall biosynthesis